MKVFVKVLARRLGKFAEDRILTEVQRWFRSGWRYSDQRLVLRDEEKFISGLPRYL